ncbi:MAG: fibronectin-binding domain-containing protein [Candidatus Micrarchaeota archaeon]|nr:fibronectin-binding domain-containing protein [Candidatus Micrarchaeota archaeon]
MSTVAHGEFSGKSEMTAVDIRYLVRELKSVLEGGFFRKIFQWKNEDGFQFIFEIYAPKALHLGSASSTKRLYIDKKRIYLSSGKMDAPQSPPGFCQLLRKRLIGSKIRNVRQHTFDRIIEIDTDEITLILEIFSSGNVILCDAQKNIIMPLYHKTWKDRTVRPNRPYEYPPQGIEPSAITFSDFKKFASESGKKLIVFLSVRMGLGSDYARDVITAANADEKQETGKIPDDVLMRIHKSMLSIFERKIEPCVYNDFVSPFRMASRKGEPKVFSSFSEALDAYFSPKIMQTFEKKKIAEQETKIEKIKRIAESQRLAIEDMKNKERHGKEVGEIIYSNYHIIKKALLSLEEARRSGLSWDDIKSKLTESHTDISRMIRRIDEKNGVITFEINDCVFDFDMKKSIDKNATAYFEMSKKMKAKIISAKKALESTMKRMEGLKTEGKEKLRKAIASRREKEMRKARWFDSFKWFVTSDGFLVVSGKDADTNEKLIRHHTKEGDFVFHTDIQGAAFTVIKAEGKKITAQAKKEAASFAAVQSKAWQRQLGAIDVYGINPDQVLKASPDGINLPKGSFYIDGEREWFKNTRVEMAIGFARDADGRPYVFSGPVPAVKSRAKYYVIIRPGATDAAELVKEIKARIVPQASSEDRKWIDSIKPEEIRRLVPGGSGFIK